MNWIRFFFKKQTRTNVLPLNFDGTLETEQEYNERWISIRIIYFTMFLMSLCFSVTLTGIWPYLDKLDPLAGKEFMGYIIAAIPFAQMLFSPLVGWWGNKMGSVRLPLMCSLGLFTVGSAMYSVIEVFSSHHKYWMFVSRFVVGVSSANIAVCRSYLSAATTIKERTGAITMLSLAQVLGFVVGPALQAAVSPLGNDGVPIFGSRLHLDMYTAIGWLNVVLGIVTCMLFLPVIFKEHYISAKEVMIAQGKETETEAWKAIKPDYVSAWLLIVAFFMLVFNFVLLETLGTSLAIDQFALTKEQSLKYMGILMSIGAVLSCATFAVIGPLCKRFDEVKVLLWGGFFMMACGMVTFIPRGDAPPQMAEIRNITIGNETFIENVELLGCPPIQEWCRTTMAMTKAQFLLGFTLALIGSPIGLTLIQTIFSKVLGPRPQGTWMGLMTGSGCLSRVLGPVFVSYIYTRMGTNWTFGLTMGMMVFALISLWIYRDRLNPLDINKTVEMVQPQKEAKTES